jgi:histidinol-phosphate aminotransferase
MIREIRESSHLYPESLCPELIAKLSARFSLPAGAFFVGNGADAIITMMGLTFLNPGDEVVFPGLSFPAYDNIAAKMGAKRVKIPMRPDFTIDTEAMTRAVTPRTKLVFLCNPNNPTGLMTGKKEFERFLACIPETALVVSDEAYWEFADAADYPDSLEYLKTHRNLVVLRSFSKIMGLAGLRIGYAMADPELVGVMMKAREPFPVNRIAQAGALAALDDHEFREKTRRLNREGLYYFYESFGAMGLTCYRSSANFVMADVGRDADFVSGELLKKGILVRSLKGQGVETGLRITVGLMEENRLLIQALKDILF